MFYLNIGLHLVIHGYITKPKHVRYSWKFLVYCKLLDLQRHAAHFYKIIWEIASFYSRSSKYI